jgi:hypothetical protein
LRLIQSRPSPKAETIKIWLAKVSYERMQEMSDPARSLDRARETWRKHGYSEKWIQQRLLTADTRLKLSREGLICWVTPFRLTQPTLRAINSVTNVFIRGSEYNNKMHQSWAARSLRSGRYRPGWHLRVTGPQSIAPRGGSRSKYKTHKKAHQRCAYIKRTEQILLLLFVHVS